MYIVFEEQSSSAHGREQGTRPSLPRVRTGGGPKRELGCRRISYQRRRVLAGWMTQGAVGQEDGHRVVVGLTEAFAGRRCDDVYKEPLDNGLCLAPLVPISPLMICEHLATTAV